MNMTTNKGAALEERLATLESAVAEVARALNLSPQQAPAGHRLLIRAGYRLESTAARPGSETR